MDRQNFKPGCTKILRNDTTITNKNDIAESFNNYLTSVALSISWKIPHTDSDFRDFLHDYKFTDTSFLPPLIPIELKKNHIKTKSNRWRSSRKSCQDD